MKKFLFIILLIFSNTSFSAWFFDQNISWQITSLAAAEHFVSYRNSTSSAEVVYSLTGNTNFISSIKIDYEYEIHINGTFSSRNWRRMYYLVSGCPAGMTLDSNNDCVIDNDCNGAYNDLDPIKLGIQCAAKKSSGQSTCSNTDTSNLNKNGNPCDASTGNKYQTEVDYRSNSLSFTRYYNSLHETQSVLGKQWTHHYLSSLTIGTTIQINRHDGKVLEFNNDTGNWISDADITDTLTQVGSNWEYKTNNDSIETYNENGQLLTEKTRDGKITTYTYYTNGLLEKVTDPYGRTLDFVYDASSRLITLTTPENTQIHYTYDDVTTNLISVIYPDDTPNDLTDNPRKTYHYEDVSFPNHLTGITDENGNRYATWAYNENGLAILSEHANSAEKVELAYNTDETTTVTDALGRIKTYTFETHYGLRKPKTIEYSYNDGQQVVTKQKTYIYYPDNGWIKEITDYNNNTTYFEYNTRGLVTLKTQAKGTPEEYTITTTWHPTYRLPSSRTYPDRIETYSYDNGQLINTQITTIQ